MKTKFFYRFKTLEEFRKDGQLREDCDIPRGWHSGGSMNKYMGKPIPKTYYSRIISGYGFSYYGWSFRRNDVIKCSVIPPLYQIF